MSFLINKNLTIDKEHMASFLFYSVSDLYLKISFKIFKVSFFTHKEIVAHKKKKQIPINELHDHSIY